MDIHKLIDLLRDGWFLPDLGSETKEKVLEELLQPLVDDKRVKSKDLVLEILNKRETLGSTGIGKGVAIPHCRTLAASDVNVVIGISAKGVRYDAVDGKKVHLFFLIVAPPHEESNSYLPILGKIVEMVRDKKVRKALVKMRDFQSFLDVIEKG